MKAIFLSNNPNKIFEVYPAANIAQIKGMCALQDVVVTHMTLSDHAEMTRSADYIFSTWGMPSLSAGEIEQYFPKVKAVFYAAGSVQAFARPFIDKGIRVISAWQANAVPVAEYASAQIILANKGFFHCIRNAKTAYQAARQTAGLFPGNYSTKVGILGAGMIGSLVIQKLRDMNVEIQVFDPFLSEKRAQALGVTCCDLPEIFSRCQTISNHLANNPQTRHILTSVHFDAMLPQAVFINTGRGAQVVEADLMKALLNEPGRMAILDVMDPEPPMADNPLLSLDNVILTPHIAGSMGYEVHRMSQYVIDDFRRIAAGSEPLYEVTGEMLAIMA